jgi:methylated-DNA-protein-cysteine methyltransferase-like protein
MTVNGAIQYIRKIYAIVSGIPYGQVASYGQIAEIVPISSARIVGFALASLNGSRENIPWHRVVNHKGQISSRHPGQMLTQQSRLLNEGIHFDAKGRIDFDLFRWQPTLNV